MAGPCGALEPQRKQGGAKETGTAKAWPQGGQSKPDADATKCKRLQRGCSDARKAFNILQN